MAKTQRHFGNTSERMTEFDCQNLKEINLDESTFVPSREVRCR